MQFNYPTRERKKHSSHLPDTYLRTNIALTTMLSPNLTSINLPRFSQYDKSTVTTTGISSLLTRTTHIKEDFKPRILLKYDYADNIEKIIEKERATNMYYYRKNEVFPPRQQIRVNKTQMMFNYNTTFPFNRYGDSHKGINTLVLPKNKGRRNNIEDEDKMALTRSMNESHSINVDNSIIMIQSIWRGIILRKQVLEQLTIYYRNRDFVKMTIKLIMIYIYEAFILIKNTNTNKRKKVRAVKKPYCFKSNILQASNAHNKKSFPLKSLLQNGINNNENDKEQFHNEPKLMKKTILLPNNKLIEPKTIEGVQETIVLETSLENDRKVLNETLDPNLEQKKLLKVSSSSLTLKQNRGIGGEEVIEIKEQLETEKRRSKKEQETLLLNSFCFEIFTGVSKKCTIESSPRKHNNFIRNNQIENINVLQVIQSKIHQFNQATFNKETSNLINYIITDDIPTNKKENWHSINRFSVSFLTEQKKMPLIKLIPLYSKEIIYSYSFLSSPKIKKLHFINPEEALQNTNQKVISNRSMLSKRFQKYVADDLRSYSSHRRIKMEEMAFSFEAVMNICSYDITTCGFDLICDKAASDDFIIQNRIDYFNLKESIFTKNIRPHQTLTRSISSFSVGYLNPYSQLKIARNAQRQIELISSFSLQCKEEGSKSSNDDQQKINLSPTFGLSNVIRKRYKASFSLKPLFSNKNILPKTLYNTITTVIGRYVGYSFYIIFFRKTDLMRTILIKKEDKCIKMYLFKWKYMTISAILIDKLNKTRSNESNTYSIENNYILSFLGENHQNEKVTAKILKPSKKVHKENEMVSHSERNIRPSSFINLTQSIDCSFQLLNIKTNVTYHHYSFGAKNNFKAITSRKNILNNSINTPASNLLSSNHIISSSQCANIIKTGSNIHSPRSTLLWRIIPKLSYKLYSITYKKFIKWRIYAASSLRLSIKTKAILLNQIIKKHLKRNEKHNKRQLSDSFFHWRRLTKNSSLVIQVISFRGNGRNSLVMEAKIKQFGKIFHDLILGIIFRKIYKYSEVSMKSFHHVSFSSVKRSNSSELELINDKRLNQGLALRSKHVRIKSREDSHPLINSHKAEKYFRKMNVKKVESCPPLPRKFLIPIDKQTVLSKEKLQLKTIIQQLKLQGKTEIAKKRKSTLLKVICTNYTKYFRLTSSSIEVFFWKWLLVSSIASIKDKHHLLKRLLFRLNKQTRLKLSFLRWKTSCGYQEISFSRITSTKRKSSAYLSLYIYFNQWRYINNSEMLHIRHINDAFVNLYLIMIKYHKKKLLFYLKTN